MPNRSLQGSHFMLRMLHSEGVLGQPDVQKPKGKCIVHLNMVTEVAERRQIIKMLMNWKPGVVHIVTC